MSDDLKVVDKEVNLSLVGLEGNAFNLMAKFKQQAEREDWTEEEINKVLGEAKSGEYHHLVVTLMAHCDPENE